jgi:predicted metal-dependent RNase
MKHLMTYLPNSKNSYLIVGFQAEGTLGRTLIQKPDEVELNG